MKKYFVNDFTDEKINAVKSIISLFKAVPYDNGNCSNLVQNNTQNNQSNTIALGFMFSEKALQNCNNYTTNNDILKYIFKEYGYDVKNELNNGFYKNFNTPLNSSRLELYLNQIVHYITTYGFMRDGYYDNNVPIYIPNDKLELPDGISPIKITVIDAIEENEIENKIKNMLCSGIALTSNTLNHIVNILKYYKFYIDIDTIKNKESKIFICDLMNILPANPIEFLRFIMYLATNNTLIIKNKRTIDIIKFYMSDEDNRRKILNKINSYLINVSDGFEHLSSIFLRFKPIWLAFKHKRSKDLNRIINKLNKLSRVYHKPTQEKILDKLSKDITLSTEEIKNELNSITNFRKISIINGLLYRLQEDPEYSLYFIRNGRSYVTNYTHKSNSYLNKYNEYIKLVFDNLIENISPKIKGKKIHLPNDITYIAPTSDRKFFGNIPYGSYYTFKSKNTVLGVHWFNIKDNSKRERNIDLDLRLQSTRRDIGWNNWTGNANFLDLKNKEWIFSGDMTTAPIDKGGATECYYLSDKFTNEFAVLTLHFYNIGILKRNEFKEIEQTKVPFSLVIDDAIMDRFEKKQKITRENLFDPRTVQFSIPYEISTDKLSIGFLDSDEEGNKKFYFYGTQVGNGRVSSNDNNTVHMLNYMKKYFDSCLTLKEILEKAGAIFEKEDNEEWDIDLDTTKITKNQLIELFS